jgi:hypothetical protein
MHRAKPCIFQMETDLAIKALATQDTEGDPDPVSKWM